VHWPLRSVTGTCCSLLRHTTSHALWRPIQVKITCYMLQEHVTLSLSLSSSTWIRSLRHVTDLLSCYIYCYTTWPSRHIWAAGGACPAGAVEICLRHPWYINTPCLRRALLKPSATALLSVRHMLSYGSCFNPALCFCCICHATPSALLTPAAAACNC
jgi:hypothetical protein